MEELNNSEELLAFFKALADGNRLKIVGLLAEQSLTVEQLAEILNLRPSTVSHHLARLSEAGLVSARAQSYYNIYSLETGVLEKMARGLLSGSALPAAASDVDVEAYDRKVVHNYLQPDGSLKNIPAQHKKLEAILRHVVQAFEPGRRYSEKQVNEILAGYHSDTATLRRELIGHRLLQREGGGGDYWRPETDKV